MSDVIQFLHNSRFPPAVTQGLKRNKKRQREKAPTQGNLDSLNLLLFSIPPSE